MTLREAGKVLGITPEAVAYRIKHGKVKAHKVNGYRGSRQWNITSLYGGDKTATEVSTQQASTNGNGLARELLIVGTARKFPTLPNETVIQIADWIVARGE